MLVAEMGVDVHFHKMTSKGLSTSKVKLSVKDLILFSSYRKRPDHSSSGLA